MDIREWVHNHSLTVTAITMLLLAMALGGLAWQMDMVGGATVSTAYYYDLNTGEIFEAEAGLHPPIATDTGPAAGVQATVFTCGACEPGERFIGWLTKYTPEAKEVMDEAPQDVSQMPPAAYEAMVNGKLVRSLEILEWVPVNSHFGRQITTAVSDRCPDNTTPQMCTPN